MCESPNSTSDRTHQIQQKLDSSYKITWRVNNFRSYEQYKNGKSIESDTFNTNFGGRIQVWFLKMYPSGYNNEFKEYVSLYLGCKSKCTVSFKFAILDKTDTELCVCRSENHLFSISASSWGWNQYVTRYELFGENSKLLVNGALTVLCVVTKSETENVTHPKNASGQLSIDFGDLLKSSRLSDLTITVGEKEFHVHRAILAARSPVFSAMFDHNLKENSAGRLDISDMSHVTMEVLLNYIYTGECPDTGEVVEDLLRASDKYQLDELKDTCRNNLLTRITGDNATSLLVLADLYNAPQLKKDVLKYITNNFKAVAISEGWKNLSTINPSLSVEVKDRVIEHLILNK